MRIHVKFGWWGIALFALLAIAVLGSEGCYRKVNTSNPKVVFAVTVLDAATAVDDFSIALKAANDGVTQLKATEPEYYASVHPYLVRLAKLNDKAIAAVKAAEAGDTAADWKGALRAIAIEAGKTDPTVFGFKNPQSQASAKILFASFSLAVEAIAASFGTAGAPGTGGK
jgi:hypothetical protein